MKKLFIFMHSMGLGGAERALLGFLESIDYSELEVDLFLMRHEGELLSFVPPQVNILPQLLEYTCLATPIGSVIKSGHLLLALRRAAGKLSAAGYVKKHKLPADNGVALEYSHKYTLPVMPMMSDKHYDYAISFLTPHYFVRDRVSADKKAAWIHTDYSNVPIDVDSESEMWRGYDKIVSISDAVTASFKRLFPSLGDRLVMIENTLPFSLIRQQSAAFDAEAEMPPFDGLRLLSVGRFCYAKNFDNVPAICSGLLRAGIKVKWYLIGYGPDEELIRKRIAESGMSDSVIILGKKSNPYPYMRACDVYVQPSRYEGKCVCVCEAQLLHKPVVITAYPTSGSQLEDKKDGFILPLESGQFTEALASLLSFPEKLKAVADKACRRDHLDSPCSDLLKNL